MKYKFIPGLDLSEHFYEKAVRPIFKAHFPELNYSAARLDYGSDVLGFDTPMSMDHGWGLRLTIYLSEEQYVNYHDRLDNYFANHLPFEVLGFPTNFGEPYADGGVMSLKKTYPLHHGITITTPEKWFQEYLGVDIHQPITPSIWLTIPQQRLATLKAGHIFHDGLIYLNELQQTFDWYPYDIWLYLLSAQWRRIDQDEPFVGRTGIVGDELGSRLIAARLVKDLMLLGFLMSKTYAPYRKWFGSAFQRLEMAPKITEVFNDILACEDWQSRERHLGKAYVFFGEAYNKLGITPPVEPALSKFHGRPFLVLHSGQFADALLGEIMDPEVQKLPPFLGSIDQFIDNTDLLENNAHCQTCRMLCQ